MPFGAHETMETHEILSEKINCITHFNLYAQQAKHPKLRDMIARHQKEEIMSYNQIVAYTHDYIPFRPIPSNTDIQGVKPQDIQYGLRNPPPNAPQADTTLNDREIAMAMLWCHKNGARNCSWACLETADPNLRLMLMNASATCANQAYEVFLFMNEQGVYQVPTLNDHTAKTLLHSYQPADASLNAQYGVQTGQQAWQQQPWQQQGQQAWQQGQQQGQQSWPQSAQQVWQQQRQPESWQQSWAQVGNAGANTGYGGQSYGSYYASNQNIGGSTSGNPLNVSSANSGLYGQGGAGSPSQNQGSQNQSANQNQAGDISASVNSEEEGSITQ